MNCYVHNIIGATVNWDLPTIKQTNKPANQILYQYKYILQKRYLAKLNARPSLIAGSFKANARMGFVFAAQAPNTSQTIGRYVSVRINLPE